MLVSEMNIGFNHSNRKISYWGCHIIVFMLVYKYTKENEYKHSSFGIQDKCLRSMRFVETEIENGIFIVYFLPQKCFY